MTRSCFSAVVLSPVLLGYSVSFRVSGVWCFVASLIVACHINFLQLCWGVNRIMAWMPCITVMSAFAWLWIWLLYLSTHPLGLGQCVVGPGMWCTGSVCRCCFQCCPRPYKGQEPRDVLLGGVCWWHQVTVSLVTNVSKMIRGVPPLLPTEYSVTKIQYNDTS